MPYLVNKVRSAEGLDCELCGGMSPKLTKAYIASYKDKAGKTMMVCTTCLKYQNIYQRYKITVDEYRKKEKAQGGRCASCKEKADKYWIDKHGDGFNLVCPKCKTAIGSIEGAREKKNNVIRYIEQYH